MSAYIYYMVKNVDAADKSAALNDGEVTGVMDGDDYDLLKFSAAHTFAGTEDYHVELTGVEARHAALSPLFVDYENDYTYDQTWEMSHELISLQSTYCRKVLNLFAAHFMQNYNTWSTADKIVFSRQLFPATTAMSMASLPIMKYELSLFVNTGDPNYTAPVSPLTAGMCTDAIAYIDEVMQKFPR
jgi:hypothetical protein